MAITFVDTASGATTTSTAITLPSMNEDDLVIVLVAS